LALHGPGPPDADNMIEENAGTLKREVSLGWKTVAPARALAQRQPASIQ
jgi:hypothetical protein